jgi:hypothetical protein
MSRFYAGIVVILALSQFVVIANAHDLICSEGTCFRVLPPYHVQKHHFYFHPQLRDGVPLIQGFDHWLDDYHGVACIWTWRPVATPGGPEPALAPDCMHY